MKKYLIITFLFLFHNLHSQVDTLKVFSNVMKKEIKNIVITPNNYKKDNTKRPVLYLLHGATGNFKDWIEKVPKIQDYANQFDIIIVCPDGGYTSWYFDSPIDPKMQYETYITDELVSYVDSNYNTLKNRENRAITGLSMGGHGALYLAFKNQELYGLAGSMSGGVDLLPYPKGWDIYKRLGDLSENKKVWEENSVINLIYLLERELKLIFDCGYDDFFLKDNQRLHQKLLQMNVKHDYIERPGSHNWEYWSNAIKYQILFFNESFTRSE